MDNNNKIGLVLMVILVVAYSFFSTNQAKKKQAELEAQRIEQAEEDSLNNLTQSDQTISEVPTMVESTTEEQAVIPDSIDFVQQDYDLINEDLHLTFSNLGGRINEVKLLQYESYPNYAADSTFVPLDLYTRDHSSFNWKFLGLNSDLLPYDQVNQGEDFIEFTNSEHGVLQRYAFNKDNPYIIEYSVQLPNQLSEADLEWAINFELQEHDMRSERDFTYFAYKTSEGKFKRIKKLKEEVAELVSEPLNVMTQRQRFFSQSLLGDALFTDNNFKANYNKTDSINVKHLAIASNVALDQGKANFEIFIAPNDRKILATADAQLPNIQPKGFFGLTKGFSWMFNLVRPYFANYGLLILAMTLIIKLILSPLTYRSYLSQAKMAVLKPEIAELKEKYSDDQAKFSQEQMALYNKAGVNPLGGCIPSVIQIPIFFSLYYFFRTSIFFRQKPFLWANDLSTYDEFLHLPFKLPILGDHISMFAILYGVSLAISMRMNNSMMAGGMPSAPAGNNKEGGDMQQMMQMQMKFMQYGMPIFLPIIFNSFPAALTFYYFCYNMINALQSWIIKNFIIDEDKIHQEIQENKAKPKKQSGFRKRLEDAMKMQQEMQEQQKKQNKKNTK